MEVSQCVYICDSSPSGLVEGQTFPWLDYDRERCVMLCKWCLRSGKSNTFTSGCYYITKDNCRKHTKIKDHLASCESMVYKPMFTQAVTATYKKEENCICAAMKNVYYMAKKDHPNAELSDLNFLCLSQGCDVLKGLRVDRHTNYEHSDSVQAFQQAMKVVVDEQIVNEVNDSCCFAVLIDEMSDVGMDKTLIIYLRYLVNAKVVVRYFEVVGLEGCTSDDIFNSLINVLQSKGVDIKNMYSAGTDGASVMTGKHKGVATRLQKEVNPFLIAIHCCAHRLALASAQAAHSVKLIDKFEQHLVQIFNYFHYSTKHKARLRNIFGILGQQARLFVRPCDTRWLSVTGSVEAVIANLRAMMICLASDADSGESAAIGLLKIVSTYEFMGTLHLMGDVLSHIAKLSLQFQRSTTDFSLVCGSVNAVCRVLTDMKENPGVRLKTFIDSIPYKEGQSKFYIKTIGNNISDNLQNEFVVELPEGEDGIIIFDSQEKRKIFESSRRKFIDNLVANLESRFEQVDLIKAFGIFVPCQMPPASSPVFKEYGEEEITILCNFYGKDKSVNGKTCPAIINPRELLEEWGLLKHVLYDNHRSMTFQDVWCMLMRQSCHEIYPNIVRLVKIALILPTNTADCERGFSRYNRIKTNSRARLKVSSVSYLMTLALETPPLRNIEDFNFGRSFQVWCSMKQRRIVSSNRNLPSAAADGCSSCVNLSTTLEKLLSSLDRLLKCDFYLNEVD